MGAYERQTGDMDFDGDVDMDDIDALVVALRNAGVYEDIYGVPPNANGDTDDDGDFDFDDIPGFVELLDGDPLVVSTQAVGEADAAVQLVQSPNVDVATLGPWLTAALVHRESSDQDTASRQARLRAAEERPHRILDRVLQSGHTVGQDQQRALPRVRWTVQGVSNKPSMVELAAVWADDWDWLGRRPP